MYFLLCAGFGNLLRLLSLLDLVSCERGRQVAIGVDLLLEVLHLLLGDGDGIGTSDKTARRGLLAGNRDECLPEPGRVAALLAVHGIVPLPPLGMTVCIVREGQLVGDRRR